MHATLALTAPDAVEAPVVELVTPEPSTAETPKATKRRSPAPIRPAAETAEPAPATDTQKDAA